jgi:hypothetical protein
LAQTLTVLEGGQSGDFMRLKCVAINVANSAAETSIAVDFSVHGMNTVLFYGATPRDTFTQGAVGQFANLVGTTVTFTWTAADIANVIVWAVGY